MPSTHPASVQLLPARHPGTSPGPIVATTVAATKRSLTRRGNALVYFVPTRETREAVPQSDVGSMAENAREHQRVTLRACPLLVFPAEKRVLPSAYGSGARGTTA